MANMHKHLLAARQSLQSLPGMLKAVILLQCLLPSAVLYFSWKSWQMEMAVIRKLLDVTEALLPLLSTGEFNEVYPVLAEFLALLKANPWPLVATAVTTLLLAIMGIALFLLTTWPEKRSAVPFYEGLACK